MLPDPDMDVVGLRHSSVVAVLATAIVAIAVALIGVPAWELIGLGPFSWHLQTAAFWQGGIEVLVLLVLLGAGLAVNRRVALGLLVVVPSLLYLRRHAVDVPLLLDVLYLEIIVGLGMALRRVLRLPAPASTLDYLTAFVSGLALWSACAWTASALQHGSIQDLRWLTLLAAIAALLARRPPLMAFLCRRVREQTRGDRIWCGLLAGWLLVLFARTRTATGFDALWYGLRTQYVFVPGHSAYESLGLTSPVHYYPKLYEMFLLPLSALRDFSVLDGMSILFLLLILLVCRLLMGELATPARAQFPLLAAVATLPALANVAIEAKPDVPATFFVLFAAFFALHVVRRRSLPATAWLVACVALAGSTKLTAIPYAGVMLVMTVVASRLPVGPSGATHERFERRLARTALLLAVATAIFVTARTWLLAGLPTIGPDPLVKAWLALGFHFTEPSGTLNWSHPQVWADVPALMFDWLLRPQRLPHIVISWTGNVWFWLGLVAVGCGLIPAGRRAGSATAPWPLLALIVTGLALALGNRFMVRGGDGNYFLCALLPCILCTGTAAFTRLRAVPVAFALALVCLPAFVFFQSGYSFASAAWTPGTRAFDMDFSRSPRALRHQRLRLTEYYGLSTISAYIASLPHDARGSGVVADEVQFWLPGRFEDFATISYSRPDYMVDPASMRRFLRRQHIDYLVMPIEPSTVLAGWDVMKPAALDLATQLEALPGVTRIDDRKYYLLDLREVDPAVLSPGNALSTAR